MTRLALFALNLSWARPLAADSKNVEESGDHATSLAWFSRLEATRSSGFRGVNA